MQHCIRAPPRRGRYWEIHPRRPKDFPRPERFPEGEARGKSRGSREIWRAEGMDFPIPPEFWWSTDNLSASIFLQGVDQKILPCRQGRIDSVKSNLFIKMMIEWWMLSRWATTKGIPILSQAVGFLMSDFQPNQILMTPRISYLFCAAIFFVVVVTNTLSRCKARYFVSDNGFLTIWGRDEVKLSDIKVVRWEVSFTNQLAAGSGLVELTPKKCKFNFGGL